MSGLQSDVSIIMPTMASRERAASLRRRSTPSSRSRARAGFRWSS